MVISTLPALYNGGFLIAQRTAKSVAALCILSIAYFLTKKTGKTFFMKWMPFLFVLFQISLANYIVFYTLSEEG